MKSRNQLPPKPAIWLLEHFLPSELKDEIIGDLFEEYSTTKQSQKKAWIWYHTFAVIGRTNMNQRNALTLFSSIVSVFVFVMLTVAVLYISNATDETVFTKPYWTDGSVHLFFAESAYWQHYNNFLTDFKWQIFINVPSILWAIVSLSVLTVVLKNTKIRHEIFFVLALILLFSPYLYGVVSFQLNEFALRESGPLIAFMWLSIWYLVLPVCYLINRHSRKVAFQ